VIYFKGDCLTEVTVLSALTVLYKASDIKYYLNIFSFDNLILKYFNKLQYLCQFAILSVMFFIHIFLCFNIKIF